MSPSATAIRLVAVLLLLLSSVASTAQTVHDTGTVQFEVFGDGFLGADLGTGTGFVFGGANGLFEGDFLVGADYEQVSGQPYSSNTPGYYEWVNRSGPEPLTPPYPVPYEEFDEAYAASYDDTVAPNPIGVTVIERSYSVEAEDFVVFEFAVTNTSGGPLEGIYIGVFADFDVGDWSQNLANFDESTESVYVWDASGTDTDYFGVTTIIGNLSGWDINVGVEGCTGYEPGLYVSLSVQSGIIPEDPDDRCAVIGTGPYDLAAGATAVAVFAFVAGTDEADFLANVQAARNTVLLASELPVEGAGLRLHQTYPNPFRGQTTISFSLDAPWPVRLAVYDALGREVAVLAEGTRSAGQHTVTWDASTLPSGVYVARLEVGGAHVTRPMLHVR